jgi:hypothetical protein
MAPKHTFFQVAGGRFSVGELIHCTRCSTGRTRSCRLPGSRSGTPSSFSAPGSVIACNHVWWNAHDGVPPMTECPKCRSGNVRRCRLDRPPDLLLSLFYLSPFRCCHCGRRFFWFRGTRGIPSFMTTLFILSALLLAGWFVALHSLWKGPPPATMEDSPKPIETLVQQKPRL